MVIRKGIKLYLGKEWWEGDIISTKYEYGGICLEYANEQEGLIANLTSWVEGLEDGEGIIMRTHRVIKQGWVEFPICKLVEDRVMSLNVDEGEE